MKVKPLYEISENVSEKYRKLFEDESKFESLQKDLVAHMKEHPDDANIESMTELASQIFEIPDEVIKDLKKKAPAKKKQTVKRKMKPTTEEDIELFSDLY